MEILKVKERRLNEELIGYIINNEIFIPIGSESQELKDWLDNNTIELHQTEEDLEISRVKYINTKCGEIILSKYQDHTQRNIGFLLNPYTEEDRAKMFAFIEEKRAICHKAIDNKTSPEDIDWLQR